MSSETYWTFETLHTLLAQRIDDLSQRLDERHATQQEEIKDGDEHVLHYINTRIDDILAAGQVRQNMLDERFASQQMAVEKALASAEKAVNLRQDGADREFHEHLQQVRHENELAFTNADKAVNAAFDASDRAITKQEVASEKRFQSVNAFREQLDTMISTLMPREVAEAANAELRATVLALSSRLDLQDGRTQGADVASTLREIQAQIDSNSASIINSAGRSQGSSQLYGWLIAGFGLVISVIVAAIVIANYATSH